VSNAVRTATRGELMQCSNAITVFPSFKPRVQDAERSWAPDVRTPAATPGNFSTIATPTGLWYT
jgi:hypothetical protein